MYTRTYWVDHVVDTDGKVLQEGTPLDQKHMNNIEEGIVGVEKQLADHYTKDEIEARRTKILTVTAPAAGWVAGSYAVAWDDGTSTTYVYRNRVTVEGVTADSRLAVNQRTQPTNAVCQVAALEAGAGVVDFYADSAVSADAVFVVEVTNNV